MLLAVWSLSSVSADQPLTPATLEPCPFTPDEIQSALEVSVEKGEAAEMNSPGVRDVGCLYPIKDTSTVISVRQTWDPANETSKSAEVGLQSVPGDPDNAKWKAGGKDESSVELTYTRGKVRTKVLVHGGAFQESEMQPKMLRLKRVP
jgi:hypothetical protein